MSLFEPTLFARQEKGTADDRIGQVLPNVVMIISDDQSWTDYGLMGHPHIQTPNLDRLAKQSVLFRNGYVTTALCRPSLATMITGKYAFQHGITGNDPAGLNLKRDSKPYRDLRHQLIAKIDATPTLPQRLNELGYLSFQSGKWWEGNFQRGGFTDGMTRGFPQPGGRHGDDGLTIGRQGLEPISQFLDKATHQQRPFFLWYAPFLPHEPHTPPEEILQRYLGKEGVSPAQASYFAMCEWFDQTCGELLMMLDERQLAENTIVIYVTDNGWVQLPEQSNRGSFADHSKQSPREGGIRTPIMIRWPGHLAPAERSERISTIDLVPTVLAAVGLPSDRDLPGRNWLPILQDGIAAEPRDLFGESFAHDIADLDQPEASLNHRWVIRGPWKLILSYDGDQQRMKYPIRDFRPQLYQLEKDPQETRNVAADHPDLLKELSTAIEAWYPVKQRRTCVRWSDQPVTLSDLSSTGEVSNPGSRPQGK